MNVDRDAETGRGPQSAHMEHLELLEAALASMTDAVVVVDAGGRQVFVNEAARRLVQAEPSREPSAAPPSTALELRDLDGRPLLQGEKPLERALQGETLLDVRLMLGAPDGSDVVLDGAASPIRDRTGSVSGAVWVFRDITCRMEARRESEPPPDTAGVTRPTELERLKEQFVSVAAHELKTPVTVMKGYAQALLRMGEGIPVAQRRMLEAIDRGADRIDRIVADLLDISRLHLDRLELAAEEFDLSGLVRDVVERMALTTSNHLVSVVRTERAEVRGDRHRLEQVVTNLLDNAIKYSPFGGNVDVEVAVRGREAVVSVGDRGVGIPKDRQPRIFERFYRAHNDTPYDYGGVGVGLYISREIVCRHGGRMWFESEEGRGSVFHFSLPLRAGGGGGGAKTRRSWPTRRRRRVAPGGERR